MRPHQNLEVWKKSVDFSVKVYRITERFPSDERFWINQPDKTGVGVYSGQHCRGRGSKINTRVSKFSLYRSGISE